MALRRGLLGSMVVVVVVLLASACGGSAEVSGTSSSAPASAPASAGEISEPEVDVESEPASEPGTASEVAGDVDLHVLLSEWIVEPTPAAVVAGSVVVEADDQGGDEHELVIIRADDPADLPTDADGAVDEAGIAEDDFIGEIEELEPGSNEQATFELEPGTYVLMCNITETEDDGEVVSHFAEGMSATLTVE